jgi:hypothetical protein
MELLRLYYFLKDGASFIDFRSFWAEWLCFSKKIFGNSFWLDGKMLS